MKMTKSMLRSGSALVVVAAAGFYPTASYAGCVFSPSSPAVLECAAGNYDTPITYQQNDLEIRLNGAVKNTTDESSAISNKALTDAAFFQTVDLGDGNVEIYAVGLGHSGVEMIGGNGHLFLSGNAFISTDGDIAPAIDMRTAGDVDIEYAGKIVTIGTASSGINVEAGGDISAEINADIFTAGGASPAIYLNRTNAVDTGSIDVTYDGTIGITGGSGDIVAALLAKQPIDDSGSAIVPNGVDMALATADPDEKQPFIVPAFGIYVENANGDINAILNGQLRVADAANDAEQGPIGVYLSALDGDISLAGDMDIEVTGDNAVGIRAKADSGNVDVIYSGNIFVSGEGATGVLIDGEEIDASFSGNIAAAGDGSIGIFARGDDVYVENSGSVAGGGGADGRGIKVLGDSYAELHNYGRIGSFNEYAAQVSSENGEAYLINDGTIFGEVDVFGEDGGWFYNNGTFEASGYSFVSDWLDNNGTIKVSRATRPGFGDITLDAKVSNEGLISLINGAVGDELEVTKDYESDGGVIALDAKLQAGNKSDYIYLNGDVDGLTTLQVRNLAEAVTVEDGTFVSLVETQETALENFNLAGGVLQSGFSDWHLIEREDDDYYYVGVEASTSQARIEDMKNIGAGNFDVFDMTAPATSATPDGGAAAAEPLGYVTKQKKTFPIEVAGSSTGKGSSKGPRIVAYGYGNGIDITRKNNDGIKAASFLSGVDVINNDIAEAGDQLSVGIFAGYASGKIAFAGGSTGQSDVTALGIRARYDWNNTYVASSARFGFGENEYLVGGAQGAAKTLTYGSTLEIGHRFKMPEGFYLEPSVNLAVTRMNSGKANVGGTIVDADALSVNYGGALKAGLQNTTESGWTLDTFASAGVNFETVKGQTLVDSVSVAAAGRDPVFTLGGGFAATSPSGNIVAKISGAGFTGGQKGFSVGGSLHFKLSE